MGVETGHLPVGRPESVTPSETYRNAENEFVLAVGGPPPTLTTDLGADRFSRRGAYGLT